MGLQAKIWWNGRKVDATHIARKMLKRSQRALKKAGFKVPEFPIIGMMLDKKLTQADMQIDLYNEGMDHHSFAMHYADILKRKNQFPAWLENADPLESIDIGDVDAYILSNISHSTPYYHLVEVLGFPTGLAETYIEKLVRKGKIKVRKSPRSGARYSKT